MVLYIDPYLSDRVREIEGEEMRRLIPVLLPAKTVNDAQYILVSHIHLDHCDLSTLLPISLASPEAKFICPNEVVCHLVQNGISSVRTLIARESQIRLSGDLSVTPVPAAHPTVERDEEGLLRYVGYVVEYRGKRIYHAGDTAVDDQIRRRLLDLAPIEAAFLPVNERNYYREKRGIIGNMSIREAFLLAEEIGAQVVVPMHWDMFAPNCVYQEEIELVYSRMRPRFEIRLNPSTI
jgi:L-ascorbate metabolism protein UlaG (beta-lactamase superfamily)